MKARERITFRSRLDVPPDRIFSRLVQPAALRRLVAPWQDATVLGHEGVREGARATVQLSIGPFTVDWVAEHTDVVSGEMFVDEQIKGPFRRWRHVHRVEETRGGSLLEDTVEYRLPLGAITRPLLGTSIRKQIERVFAYRHRTTANDIRLHEAYGNGRPLRVAVSGSSGLIGSHLINFLEVGGHEVFRMVRSTPQNPEREIHFNHREDIIEGEKLEGLDAVVHLAGESVLSPRWSEQKKMEIIGSRLGGTRQLAQTIARLDEPPAAFLSASAIGYYGSRGAEKLQEESPPGDDGFLSALCQDWEKATLPAAEAGIRTVQMRMGIVLTPQGGVLRPLLLPFRMGLGGRYGGRDQYLSWIGLDDAIAAIYYLIAGTDLAGPVNVTSPNPVTMTELAQTLGRVLHRPAYINMPPLLVRLLLGQVADDAALMSVRALPSRLEDAGHTFIYPDLEKMLRHVLGRSLEPIRKPAVDERAYSTNIPAPSS